MSEKTAEQRVLDSQAWADFCDALKEAGKLLDAPKAPQDIFNRAEGYRYLTRMLRARPARAFRPPAIDPWRPGIPAAGAPPVPPRAARP